MVYYNRLSRIWVFDELDVLLLSAFAGSLLANYLKNYLSEQAAMKRLEKSIIKKSGFTKSKAPLLNARKRKKVEKIQKIYRFALNPRGGQFDDFEARQEFSNESFKLAQAIQKFVERLAQYLKEREMRGLLRIFFKGSRLVLELILMKCQIDMSYQILSKGLSTQVIVITSTVGGATGFTIAWFSAGASLVFPPLLISALLVRSFTQQILHQREYLRFKEMINKLLEDEKIKGTLRAYFTEGESELVNPRLWELEMKPLDLDLDTLLKHDFESKSGEEFIKAYLESEYGLVENPTDSQLEEIIREKVTSKPRPRAKSTNLQELKEKLSKSKGADFSNTDDDIFEDILDNIIDAEIVEEPIRIKLEKDNEL